MIFFLKLCLLAIIFLTSCKMVNKDNSFNAPTREVFSETIIDEDSNLLMGSRSYISAVINRDVYIFDPWGGYFFTKYDASKNKVYRFCRQGQGPNEVINASFSTTLVTKNDSSYISIFDNYNSKFLFFSTNDVTNNNYVQESSLFEKGMTAEAFPINDSIVIARGVFDNNICMFLKKGLKQATYLEAFTKVGDNTPNKIMKDANRFALSPNKEYLIRIAQNGGLIEGYKIKNMYLIQLFSHVYFDVICDKQLHDTSDSRYGYIDISVSNDKIYGLYDGGLVNRVNTFRSNVIHVYSLEGELLEKLFLDQYVESIGINYENTQLFAKSQSNNLIVFRL